MGWQKVVTGSLLGLCALVLSVVVLSVVLGVIGTVFGLSFAVLGLLWGVTGLLVALLVPAVSLAVFGALVYGAYRLLSGSDDPESVGEGHAERSPSDPVERTKDRYARGEISERELERRLELELERADRDPIDRDLQRERN
jgi:uncharacterized membrane protein